MRYDSLKAKCQQSVGDADTSARPMQDRICLRHHGLPGLLLRPISHGVETERFVRGLSPQAALCIEVGYGYPVADLPLAQTS